MSTYRELLNLNFIGPNRPDPIVTLTRASSATIKDKTTGNLRTVAADIARGWADACGRQELWKAGSKNLFSYSGRCSLTPAEISQSTITEIAGATDKGMRVTASATSNYNALKVSLSAGATVTFSWYARRVGSSAASYYIDGASGVLTAITDYSSQINASGWSRVSVTVTTTSTGLHYFDASRLAGAGNAVDICDIQLEPSATATAYEPNPVVFQPGLGLEGAATNLGDNSKGFGSWQNDGTNTRTANYAAGIDGGTNSTRITGGGYIYYGTSQTNGTYILSGWFRSTSGAGQVALNATGFSPSHFVLDTTWKRVYKEFTVASGANYFDFGNFSADVQCDGLMLVAGTALQSLIETTSGTVTRAADNASIDMANLWNPQEGTLVVEADFGPVNGTVQTAFDSTSGQRISVYRDVAGDLRVAGTGVTTINLGVITGRARVALAIASLTLKVSANGGAISSSAISAITPTTLYVGKNSFNGEHLNGTLQYLAYHRFAMDDETLQKASILA